MTLLIPFAFALSLMISPDTQVIIGQLIGRTGSLGLLCIIVAMIFYLGLLPHLRVAGYSRHTGGGLILPLTAAADTLEFMAKIITAVFVIVGLTVSAGFAFNEIFVYWFPNFGFAFLLLAVLTAVQRLPSRTIAVLQVFFVFAALAGFAVLIGSGMVMLTGPDVLPHPGDEISPAPFLAVGLASSLLMFIGVDMGLDAGKISKIKENRQYLALLIAVIVMAALFLLWGRILLALPLGDRLVYSTIPHILGARALLGETGRYIVGVMIILGACAAVNGLLFAVQTQGKKMKFRHPLAGVLAVSIAAGGLMALGLAGYSQLETMIKGAMAVWLASYSIKSFLSGLVEERILFKIRDMVWFGIASAAWVTLAATAEHTKWMVALITTLTLLMLCVSAYQVMRQRGKNLRTDSQNQST